MPDQYPKGREWTIWVCEICGGGTGASDELEPRCSCEPPLEPCPGDGIEVVPAARLREVEEERDELLRRLDQPPSEEER